MATAAARAVFALGDCWGVSQAMSDPDQAKLGHLLTSVAQGDLISVGVVNIAGRGRSEDLSEAGIEAPDDI